MAEKKLQFSYFLKLRNEISLVTESIILAHRSIFIQRNDIIGGVIMTIIFERDSRHVMNVRKLTKTTGGFN